MNIYSLFFIKNKINSKKLKTYIINIFNNILFLKFYIQNYIIKININILNKIYV